MSSNQAFRQCMNQLTGKMEWICVREDDDLRQEIARSTYAGMLHDKDRNKKYYDALKETISELKTKDSIHILDIGTGSGILAMMAARAGANTVTACEVFQPMTFIAEKVILRNELHDKIDIVKKRSTEMEIPSDMYRQADILVTEIFDSELIGEGVLPTLADAHKRLLTPNARVIPSSANVYVQLIQSDKLWNMNKLNQKKFPFKFPSSFAKCDGTANSHEIQISHLYPENIKLLTSHSCIKTFNFAKSNSLESTSKISMSRKTLAIDTSGVIHAVLLWWDLVLHESKDIRLSMHPAWIGENLWRDHWMQAVYYLREPLHVKPHEKVVVTMRHDDFSVWFDVDTSSFEEKIVERPLCSCRLHIMWPRERFALMNNDFYLSYLQKLITLISERSCAIGVLGDNSLLPLLAASRNQDIIYQEHSEFSSSFIEKLSTINKIKNIKIKSISNDEFEEVFPEVIISEPFFSSSLLPWHHLQFWTIIANLYGSNNMKIYPQRAILKACVVSFKELWKVRAPVQAIEGFDMSDFDQLIESAMKPIEFGHFGYFEHVEPFAVWEFETEKLSQPVTICEFDFNEKPYHHIQQFRGLIKNISKPCNAIVLWMDFHINDDLYWSTGLDVEDQFVNYSKQGVYFLKQNQNETSIDYNVLFLPEENEFVFSFS